MSRYLRKRHELEEEEARTKKTSPEDDTTIGPDAFTLAPPSIESLQIKRSRVVVKGWHKTLENIVKQLGHHPQAPIVLVDVYPPYLTSEQLEDFIKRDEHARGVSWHASKAVSLQPPEVRAKGQGPHQVMDMRVDHPTNSNKQEAKIVSKTPGRDEVRKGRFIIAFPTDTRAARFHRSWHQRTLTVTGPRDTVFHCTVNVQTVRW